MPEQDPLHTQEQGVIIDREYILTHRDTVLDFFGDNRETWYRKLNTPGIKYAKVSLDDTDAELNLMPWEKEKAADFLPLSMLKLCDKVDSIVAFFDEVPGAKEALREYGEHELREKTKPLHPALDDLYGANI
jgi:hypothetical protein